MRTAIILAVLGISGSGALARTFTVRNNCAYTVWYAAIFTDLNVGSATPNYPTGWEAAPHTSVSFSVPNNWRAGRIWGRRDCNFNGNPGPNSCVTGGCNGGLRCDPRTGTGVPPVTLAEFTLSSGGPPDFYDVSVVDGFNIPLRISPTAGCPTAECPVDLNPSCPGQIAGPRDSSGRVEGCRSACQAGLAPDPGNSPNCCTGSHSTPATCPASGVQYYSYFKGRCPRSYVYAYDESSGTALWTCNRQADYTVTFCP
ncbi:thaumatin-like protein [Dentipellis sp. KUC8613]|nr:thaumatin-like protein [Dentipellis sp. KUC8613]